ncbi:MAG: AMP-binding protein [Rhodobacterales bacterium]|nr:AMP-binding protein [Rhodobacterales bacterium]
MTDRFRWHPEARLFDSAGAEVRRDARPASSLRAREGIGQPVTSGIVLPDTPKGLAAAIGHSAFRIGASDQPPPEPHSQPVLETLTSGSTGHPRRIRRTQASWTASFAVNARFGIGPGARVATLGRLVHSLALYGAIEGLHLGAEVHHLADLRPDRQRDALGTLRITHLYATPAQLRLLTEGQGHFPDLRLILVGGSKLDPALRARLATLAPIAQIREFYGAAETSFITLADGGTPETSVGRPYPGVDLRLDPTGEVWVKSSYLFLGYADAGPGSTRWRDGWLSVGEIGQIDDGYLTLKGRAGRMVTVADQNVFPEEIEALLETLPGVTRAAILLVPDAKRGHALIAVLQGDPAQEAAILTRLRHDLGPLKSPKGLIWRQVWPMLPSGKTDLKALEAALWPA